MFKRQKETKLKIEFSILCGIKVHPTKYARTISLDKFRAYLECIHAVQIWLYFVSLVTDLCFSVVSLSSLPESSSGKEYSVELRRGSKIKLGHYGATKKVPAVNRSAHFDDDPIKITSRFYQDVQTKKISPDKKEIAITVKEDTFAKRRSISLFTRRDSTRETAVLGKGTLNLGLYLEPGGTKTEYLAITTPDDKKIFTLTVKIETRWIKMDNKQLIKKALSTDALNKERLKIGEEDYVLQTTDEVTENSASTMSDHATDSISEMDLEDETIFIEDEDERGMRKVHSNSSTPLKFRSMDSKPLMVYKVKPGTSTPTYEVIEEQDTYLSLIQHSHTDLTSLQQHSTKHRRSRSETFVPYNYQGINHSVLSDQVLDIKARFEREIRSLRDRYEADHQALKKDRDKQLKRLTEEKKKWEEALHRLEDEKLKETLIELQKRLEEETRIKAELQQKLDKSAKKSKRKDKEEKLSKLSHDFQTLSAELQQSKDESLMLTIKHKEEEEVNKKNLEKINKLNNIIQDQTKTIDDLELQLDELKEMFRRAKASQENAWEELNAFQVKKEVDDQVKTRIQQELIDLDRKAPVDLPVRSAPSTLLFYTVAVFYLWFIMISHLISQIQL